MNSLKSNITNNPLDLNVLVNQNLTRYYQEYEDIQSNIHKCINDDIKNIIKKNENQILDHQLMIENRSDLFAKVLKESIEHELKNYHRHVILHLENADELEKINLMTFFEGFKNILISLFGESFRGLIENEELNKDLNRVWMTKINDYTNEFKKKFSITTHSTNDLNNMKTIGGATTSANSSTNQINDDYYDIYGFKKTQNPANNTTEKAGTETKKTDPAPNKKEKTEEMGGSKVIAFVKGMFSTKKQEKDPNGPTQMILGEEKKFFYDPIKKKYIFEGEEDAPDEDVPLPPKMTKSNPEVKQEKEENLKQVEEKKDADKNDLMKPPSRLPINKKKGDKKQMAQSLVQPTFIPSGKDDVVNTMQPASASSGENILKSEWHQANASSNSIGLVEEYRKEMINLLKKFEIDIRMNDFPNLVNMIKHSIQAQASKLAEYNAYIEMSNHMNLTIYKNEYNLQLENISIKKLLEQINQKIHVMPQETEHKTIEKNNEPSNIYEELFNSRYKDNSNVGNYEINSISMHYQTLNDYNSTLKKLSDSVKILHSASKSYWDLESEYNVINQKYENLKESYLKQDEMMNSYLNMIQKYEERNLNKDKLLFSLREENYKVQNALLKKEIEVINSRKELEEMQNKLSDLNNNLENMIHEIKRKRDMMNDLNNKLTQRNKQIQELEKNINQLKSTHNDLQNRYSSMGNSHDKLQAEYSKIKEDYQNLNELYTKQGEEYSNMQQEYSNIQQEYSNMQQEYSNMRQVYSNLQQEYSNLQQEYSNLQEEYSNIQQDYNALKDYCNKQQQEYEKNLNDFKMDYDKELKSQALKNSELKNINDLNQKRLELQDQQFVKLQDEIDRLVKKLEKYKAANHLLLNKNHGLNNIINELNSKIDESNQEKNVKHNSLIEANAQFKEISSGLANFTQQIANNFSEFNFEAVQKLLEEITTRGSNPANYSTNYSTIFAMIKDSLMSIIKNQKDLLELEQQKNAAEIERMTDDQEYSKKERLILEYEIKRLQDMEGIRTQAIEDIKAENVKLRTENEVIELRLQELLNDNLNKQTQIKDLQFKVSEQIVMAANYENNLDKAYGEISQLDKLMEELLNSNSKLKEENEKLMVLSTDNPTIAQLNFELSQAKQLDIKKNEEIKKLNQQIAQSRKTLMEEIDTLKKEIDALTKEIGILREEKVFVKQENVALKQENTALKDEIASKEEQIKQVNDMLQQSGKRIEVLTEQNDLLTVSIEELRTQLEDKANDKVQNEMQKAKIDELEWKIIEAEKFNSDLRNQISIMNYEKKTLESSLDKLNSELLAKIASDENELAQTKKQLIDLQVQLSERENREETISKKLKLNDEELINKIQNYEVLQSQYNSLEAELSFVSEKNKQFLHEIDNLKVLLDSTSKTHEDLINTFKINHKEEIDNYARQMESYKNTYDHQVNMNTKLVEDLEKRLKEIEELQVMLSEMSNKNQSLYAEVQAYQAKVKELECLLGQIDKLNSQIQELESNKQALESTNEELQRSNENLIEELNEQRNLIEDQNIRIKNLMNSLDNYEQTLKYNQEDHLDIEELELLAKEITTGQIYEYFLEIFSEIKNDHITQTKELFSLFLKRFGELFTKIIIDVDERDQTIIELTKSLDGLNEDNNRLSGMIEILEREKVSTQDYYSLKSLYEKKAKRVEEINAELAEKNQLIETLKKAKVSDSSMNSEDKKLVMEELVLSKNEVERLTVEMNYEKEKVKKLYQENEYLRKAHAKFDEEMAQVKRSYGEMIKKLSSEIGQKEKEIKAKQIEIPSQQQQQTIKTPKSSTASTLDESKSNVSLVETKIPSAIPPIITAINEEKKVESITSPLSETTTVKKKGFLNSFANFFLTEGEQKQFKA